MPHRQPPNIWNSGDLGLRGRMLTFFASQRVLQLIFFMMLLPRGRSLRMVCRSTSLLMSAQRSSLLIRGGADHPALGIGKSRASLPMPWLKKYGQFNGLGRLLGPSMALHASTTAMFAPAAAVQPLEHFRADYKPSPYTITEISMEFDLHATETVICTMNTIHRVAEAPTDLVLDGEDLFLKAISINSKQLLVEEYTYKDQQLTIPMASMQKYAPQAIFTLQTVTVVNPTANTALSGLYKATTSDLLSTQCEAMGFRRITFALDRPDVLSTFRVKLIGDRDLYPLLLSNGNKLSEGLLGDKKHFVIWEDPFPKPSYLFAVVAGTLARLGGSHTTTSGKVINLGIYAAPQHVDKLAHAMYSLKQAMRWDEQVFGLECDLAEYNIVATDDFNMGAM